MTSPMVRLGARWWAVALLWALLPLASHAQTITANIRGRVVGIDGRPVAQATVRATNTGTGVTRQVLTDAEGRYRFLGLLVGNYAVRAQAIGHRPLEKTGYRLQVGDELVIDFTLEAAAVEVAAIPVVVEQAPIVDPSKTGVSVRVTEDQIENLPANGRNFIDFLALAPTVAVSQNFGAGGHISIGGGRQSGTAMQIDGVQATGTFFGGDARGFERQPIAQTIEAVKEFQVITNDYDVSKGGFTGGLVNAVTKSGTNEFHGSVFNFYRNQNLAAADFFGVPPTQYRSYQFGGSLGGPILKNRLHFFAAVDRQDRVAPLSNLNTSTAAAATALGIADSTLGKIDSIMRNIYGIDPGTRGTTSTTVNETAVFGRLDWAISNNHRLTVRDNYTKLDLLNDRLVTTDFSSNGGPVPARTNSIALNLFSTWRSFFNELRLQQAYDNKPRPPEPICTTAATPVCGASPQVRIRVGGQNVALGSDSILHANDLREKTWQIVDQVTYNRGAHSIVVGTDNTKYHFFNLFFRNSLATWTWNYTGADSVVLNRLRSRTPSAFTRAIAVDSVTAPVADYDAWQVSLFAQDKWQVNERLIVNFGLRGDDSYLPDTARANPAVRDSFPTASTSRKLGVKSVWSPRAGLVYDLFGDGRTVIRGGAGRFAGFAPYVLWSNAFLNTGRDQLSVICTGAGNVPAPNVANMVGNSANIPLGCAAPGSPPLPDVNLFAADFRMPYAWKANFGFDHGISRNVAVGGEVSYAKFKDNYTVRDLNLLTSPTAILSGEGGRVVVGTAPGATGSSARRIDPRFRQVLEHDNRGKGDYVSVGVNARMLLPGRIDLTTSYQYARARDDFSVPCCQTGSMYNSTEAGRLISNDLSDNLGPTDNDRAHTFVVSAVRHAASGTTVGLIARYVSGTPYSPGISSSSDANGDGATGNDRAYIPRNQGDITIDANGSAAGLGTPAQQAAAWATLDKIINENECLARQRGTIAGRNSCRNKARFVVDLHVSQRLFDYGGRSLELVVDAFNLLNGLNRNWGRATIVSTSSLLSVAGFDAVNNRYIYNVLTTYALPRIERGGELAQFQLQLGARLRF